MNKKAFTETDIRSKSITPTLLGANGDKWNLQAQIREEVYFTRGRVMVRGKTVKRGEAKKADYILSYKPNLPLAVNEAKDNTHAAGAGMQQALEYAEILDIPFAYSSNGDAILEHDRTATSGTVTREIPLDQFPSPAELWSRYRAAKGFTPEQESVATQDYYDEGTRRTPRYYQQIAINRTVDAIARGEDRILRAACRTSTARCVVRLGGWMQGVARSQWHFHWQASQRSRRRPGAQPEGPNGILAVTNIKTRAKPCKSNPKLDQRLPPKGRSAHSRGKFDRLLTMATGTGKTYTAFQIIWRLWKSGARKRILFLVDRNILADQTKTNDFKPFGAAMTNITNRTVDKSFEIYLCLYQAVTGTEEEQNIYKQFSPGFFDLVIIDECHCGSAADDAAWRKVLEYFSAATQIGLTATPKETKDVSNIEYFGDPIYTYSLRQGSAPVVSARNFR